MTSPQKECEHDYEHPVRKGRAKLHCPKCDEDITLALVFLQEAIEKSVPQKGNWEEEFDAQFCGNQFGGLMPQHRDGGKTLRREVMDFIRVQLSKQREEENEAWRSGKRCANCGAEKSQLELSDTCPKCWEEE